MVQEQNECITERQMLNIGTQGVQKLFLDDEEISRPESAILLVSNKNRDLWGRSWVEDVILTLFFLSWRCHQQFFK